MSELAGAEAPGVVLSDVTLDGVLAEHARSLPSNEATICGLHRATYAELHDRVGRLAASLSSAGVGVGGRVAWYGQNCHRALEVILAAGALGAWACPVNWRLQADELAYVLGDLAPDVVLVGPGAPVPISDLSVDWTGPEPVVIPEDGYEAWMARELVLASNDFASDQPVLGIYTAAFEGRPVAALLSHRALLHHSVVLGGLQAISCEETYLNCGPMFHMGTLMSTFATLVAGGRNVFVPRVEPDAVCRAIAVERCSRAFLPPPSVPRIAEVARAEGLDLRSLKLPAGSGLDDLVTEDTSPWGRAPYGYGQTEVTSLLTACAIGPAGSLGEHGRALPGTEVRIVDEEMNDVPDGEPGEIVARGPTMMVGYHRRPDLTDHRRRGGWHHTTDLGRREADGSITFLGPLARLIKSGQENVYPAEVEAALRQHPKVAAAVVVGVQDATWGQIVGAVVVAASSAPTIEELDEHCRERMARYKRPRRVVVLDGAPEGGLKDSTALDLLSTAGVDVAGSETAQR